MDTPRLIERSVRNYMQGVLHQCYEQRIHYYSMVLNAGVLGLFLGVVIWVLWFRSSKKLTEEERRKNMMRDQQTVLTKIREFQSQKQRQKEQMSDLMRQYEPVSSSTASAAAAVEADHPTDLIYSMAMQRTG